MPLPSSHSTRTGVLRTHQDPSQPGGFWLGSKMKNKAPVDEGAWGAPAPGAPLFTRPPPPGSDATYGLWLREGMRAAAAAGRGGGGAPAHTKGHSPTHRILLPAMDPFSPTTFSVPRGTRQVTTSGYSGEGHMSGWSKGGGGLKAKALCFLDFCFLPFCLSLQTTYVITTTPEPNW